MTRLSLALTALLAGFGFSTGSIFLILLVSDCSFDGYIPLEDVEGVPCFAWGAPEIQEANAQTGRCRQEWDSCRDDVRDEGGAVPQDEGWMCLGTYYRCLDLSEALVDARRSRCCKLFPGEDLTDARFAQIGRLDRWGFEDGGPWGYPRCPRGETDYIEVE